MPYHILNWFGIISLAYFYMGINKKLQPFMNMAAISVNNSFIQIINSPHACLFVTRLDRCNFKEIHILNIKIPPQHCQGVEISFLLFFCRIDRCDQHPTNGTAVVLQRFVLFIRDVAGAVKQFKPVFRFITLF